MAWAGRDERYEWTNHCPSNMRNNKECCIIHSSFIGNCRQSFKSTAYQRSVHAWHNEQEFIRVRPVVKLIFILWLSWVLSHFLHIPWSTHDITYTQPQCHSHDPREQAQKGGQEGLTWVGLGWVCLCHSLPQLLATALAYLGHFIPQVHFHWHLYFWVIDKNIGKRILHDRIHLPSRSMELAGFQCYCYGVSSTPLYFLRQ